MPFRRLFLIAYRMQKQEEKALGSSITGETSMSTEADRGRKEQPLTEIMILRLFLECRLKHWSPQCSQSKKVVMKHGLSVRDPSPSPSSIYLGRHWCPLHDKCSQAIPPHSANWKWWKNWTVGRPGN